MEDIRKYMKKGGGEYYKIKSPAKKRRGVVTNYVGTNYEDTDYMVCSICIKLFKTYDKYEIHIGEHQKNMSTLNSVSIMKVFKEVSTTEASNVDPVLRYLRQEDSPMGTSESVPITSSSTENSNDTYSASLAIVKLGLPETIGDSIKSLTVAIKTINAQKIVQGVDTIITIEEFRRSIIDISRNIRHQLIKRILQSKYFSLHFAEFLDIQNFTTLIVTIRYKNETQIENEILLCRMLERTRKDEIYLIITKFMRDYNLTMENCVGISMDYIRGQCEPLKICENRIFERFAPILTYTFARRAEFITEKLPIILAETLSDAVAILNILKRDSSLKLERDMDDGYQQILHHTDNYWLSHGRLLARLFEMRDQYKHIPEINNFKDKLNSINWLLKLAYLVDLFEVFRRFNLDLQAKQLSTFHIYDKITARINILEMYKTNVEKYEFSQFPTLQHLLTTSEPLQNIDPVILSAMTESLICLQNSMNRYLPIPSEIENCSWIRNPFDVNPDKMPSNLSTDEKEMLLNLKKDGFLKTKFNEDKLDYFWLCAAKNYPELATKAMKYLLIFTKSQLSELGFASLVDMRVNRLTDLEHEEYYLLIKLSNIQPELKTLLLEAANTNNQ